MNSRTTSVDNGGAASDPAVRSIHADTGKRVWRGAGSVRGRARRLTAGARRASEGASSYVKSEPMKAILIAFAVGAALGVVMSLTSRLRRER